MTLRREGLAEVLNRNPDYFACAFVRHPFDRLVSTWLHGVRGVDPYHERPVRDLSLAEDVRIVAEGRVAEQSASDRYHLLPQVAFIPAASRKTLFGAPLLPAVTCTVLGRFERLDHDFCTVCRQLGRAEHGLPRLQAALPESGSRQPHWHERYDAATIRLVAGFYHDDMEAFGYAPPGDGRTRV